MSGILFLSIMGIGIVFCFLRMLIGPTAVDRAVALDTVTTVTIAFLVVLGYVFDRYIYLDVSLVYAVLMFVGSVAIARFLEKGI